MERLHFQQDIFWNVKAQKWEFVNYKLTSQKQINAYKLNRERPLASVTGQMSTNLNAFKSPGIPVTLEDLSSSNNFKNWLNFHKITFDGQIAANNKKLMAKALNKVKEAINQKLGSS